MTALPNQRSATRKLPDTVVGRVRSRMRLLSHDAKNLGTGLLDDLPFLLNRRSIHPILGIADALAAGSCRVKNAGATCRGLTQHPGLGEGPRVKSIDARAVVSGKRFLNNDVFPRLKSLHRELFVRGGRGAKI